ncbi:MAG: DUF3995 domain-containing protein [Acidobacteriota bacterium]
MDTVPPAGPVLTMIFVVLSLLHVYWALGGRWGLDGALPEAPPRPGEPGRPVLQPGPILTGAVAVALGAAAVVSAAASGLMETPLPDPLVTAGIWTLAVLFLLRALGDLRYVGFFKRVRGTTFARLDTWLFSPLCVVISALAFTVAMG